MSFEVLLEVFLAGIGLGFGPCFLFCIPLLFPYILAKNTTAKEGFKIMIIFSLGRILSYGILGFAVVYLINTVNIQNVYFKKVAGVFIVLVGITYIFSKVPHKLCGILNKLFVEKSRFNIFIFGMLIGLSPCAPLVGVLTYILFKSSTPIIGFGCGLSFGIGTSLSPLLIIGPLAGGISSVMSKYPRVFLLTRILSGLILFYFGIRLIL